MGDEVKSSETLISPLRGEVAPQARVSGDRSIRVRQRQNREQARQEVPLPDASAQLNEAAAILEVVREAAEPLSRAGFDRKIGLLEARVLRMARAGYGG